MCASNNIQLDANYVRVLFDHTIEVNVEDQACAGDQQISLAKNLQIPGSQQSVVGRKFLKKFRYERTSTRRPEPGEYAMLSLLHPEQGNPFVERFWVVDDSGMDIQLSRDALLRVTALWSPGAWISVPQCMLKEIITFDSMVDSPINRCSL
ncbi:hypothetical protein LTR70_004222 [Exophiala xenobiotica]|uniref:Uncharacterized protein n=1 Tax=Lithohypha guttulata TaxID=1690604 RepID=A0ABR0KEA8_9EURO|nr:hypothetical protein LTR24_003704 [Lithohypha guttulata]KAK5321509.1 hypothetical protein LTR70_004222 [Exophiala xenobiotica]